MPSFRLLSDYELIQTQCRDDVVIIYGPEDSQICALPNSTIPAGVYFIDTEDFMLVRID